MTALRLARYCTNFAGFEWKKKGFLFLLSTRQDQKVRTQWPGQPTIAAVVRRKSYMSARQNRQRREK
jgi:hypothetical protein